MVASRMTIAHAILLGFLACAQSLGAPTDGLAVYIDLAGPWHQIEADNPRFADIGWDDTKWPMVAVPMQPERRPERRYNSRRILWIRRTVSLPVGLAPGTPLVLSIGAVPSDSEVFVNGARVSEPPSPDSGPPWAASMVLARPRTYPLQPIAPATPVVLAIRIVPPLARVPVAWRGTDFDYGPWLLTSASAAPKDEAFHSLALQKLARVGDLAGALVLLCVATVILLIWRGQTGLRELLWLGLYMAVVATGRAAVYVQIGREPLLGAELSMLVLMGFGPAALLAQFVSAWTHQRWLAYIAWPTAVGGLLAFVQADSGGWRMFAGYWLLAALVLVALAIHVRRQQRDAALAIGVALVVYTHTSSWGGIDLLGLPRFAQYNLGWTRAGIVWHLVATTIFGFALTVVLVRRLVRDREEKLRLAGEFHAARTVQQLLLETQNEHSPHFSVEFIYEPTQETGGDFYWSTTATDGALLVAVGDVSGKGLKAAMLVSVVTGFLRNERAVSPAAVLKALNEGLTGQMSGGFVTCCCARFDTDGRVTIASAGHPGPYSNGAEIELEGGLPLGIARGVEYAESVVTGERFAFVSDGVVEATNTKGELFGFERTREISLRSAGDIAKAARAWGQNDDITVVTVRRAA